MFWSLSAARRSGLLPFIALAAFILILVNVVRTLIGEDHEPIFTPAGDSVKKGESPWDEKQKFAICSHYSMHQHFEDPTNPRKIYDMFLVSNELDWLWIRLNTLSQYVDYFVIVESPTTFTGNAKPLIVKDNWANLTDFHSKIIHTVVEDPGPSIGESTWDHERYLRNALFDKVFPDLPPEKAAKHGDVLIVSDVDEIPKPGTINILRWCILPDRLTLRSHFYYYSFQWMFAGEQWAHPQATTFKGLTKTILPSDLRDGIGKASGWWNQGEIWDAAWHCSSCFSTIKALQTKIHSFSHTPLDTPEMQDQKVIVDRVRSGKDLFGRPDLSYNRIENNTDLPMHIFDLKEEYPYLINRDGPNAGFTDLE